MDGNRHDTGWVHAWTGDNADFSGSDTRSLSPSLDQLVASAIARSDRLPSLEISLDAGQETGRPISYGPSGGRLPVANTPLLAWQRLFGLTSNADELVLRQREQLEFAHAEYRAVCPQLGAMQQQRLNAHFELLSGGESFAFADAVDLAHQLSTSGQVRDCYSLHWARYATGEDLDPDDERLAQLQADFRVNDDIRGLLEEIVLSELFRKLWVEDAS